VAVAADAGRQTLAGQFARLEDYEAAARSGDGEAVRRIRIATRRARTLLGSSDRELRTELRWLGGTLGPVRDLDALLGTVREIVDGLDEDRAGGEQLLRELERLRDEIAAGALTALDSDRYRALVERFRVTPALHAEPDPSEPARTARRELKRLNQVYSLLGDDPTDEDLHRVRLKAKRLRYAAQRDESLARLATAAKELQDVIGEHHDAVVAEERIRSVGTGPSLLAAGRIVELQRERRRAARAAVPRAWKRVRRAAAKTL
jgi:CHAD domain-containing protein